MQAYILMCKYVCVIEQVFLSNGDQTSVLLKREIEQMGVLLKVKLNRCSVKNRWTNHHTNLLKSYFSVNKWAWFPFKNLRKSYA